MRRPASSPGFAIVAIMILVGLIATVSATYLKHVIVESQQSVITGRSFESAEAVSSGLQFAKQSMVSGRAVSSHLTVSTGKQTAKLAVVDLPDGRARCDLQSLDSSGLGTTLLAEAARVPKAKESYSYPDELPRLWYDTVSDLLADTSIPKHYFSGQVDVEGTDLYGLVVVENTSAVYLRDVVITGAVVSERVLIDAPIGPFDANTVPCLFMDGNARIQAASFLPDVAVVMPDGVFATWSQDARIHIAGDVVAHTVTLNRPGTFAGNLASIATPTIHAGLDRPGEGRKTRPWAEALDMKGSWENEFMAFLPRYSTVTDLQPIRQYWAEFHTAQLAQPGLTEPVLTKPASQRTGVDVATSSSGSTVATGSTSSTTSGKKKSGGLIEEAVETVGGLVKTGSSSDGDP